MSALSPEAVLLISGVVALILYASSAVATTNSLLGGGTSVMERNLELFVSFCQVRPTNISGKFFINFMAS